VEASSLGSTIELQGIGKENKVMGMLRYLLFGVVSLAIASLIVLTAISSTRVWYGQTKLVTSDRQSTQIGSALAVNEKRS
jgi:hypothetical protein